MSELSPASPASDRTVRRPVSITGGRADFLQLGGTYRVQGQAGGRTIDLSARGAAETAGGSLGTGSSGAGAYSGCWPSIAGRFGFLLI